MAIHDKLENNLQKKCFSLEKDTMTQRLISSEQIGNGIRREKCHCSICIWLMKDIYRIELDRYVGH